jgi:hypothetical protein
MVRIKIACKYISKIPKRRLFEMDKFYLIHFKVEGSSEIEEDGSDDGGDNGIRVNEDDTRMEEFQHEDLLDNQKLAEGRGQATPGPSQNMGRLQGSGSKCGDSRQVATWANLFQNNVERFDLGSCEIGQYSCTKLLREMEVVDSEAEDETSDDAVEDVEMVCLPDEIYAEISSGKWLKDLPEDIYTLPDMEQCPAPQMGVEK